MNEVVLAKDVRYWGGRLKLVNGYPRLPALSLTGTTIADKFNQFELVRLRI
jgi:hypothetical protein